MSARTDVVALPASGARHSTLRHATATSESPGEARLGERKKRFMFLMMMIWSYAKLSSLTVFYFTVNSSRTEGKKSATE